MAKEKLEKTNLVQDCPHELAVFQAMAENAVDGMSLSTLEGVITYANPADHLLFGYDPERREMVGLPLLRFFSEESLKVLSEEAIPQALDGTSWQDEVRGIRKDGTQFDLLMTVFAIRDERGDPIALTAVLRDITERKRAEEMSRESEERLRILLDSTPSGIVVIDAETHVIVAANPVATEMIGVPPEQVIGSVCHNYICPAEKGRCPITDLGQTVDNSERVLLNADGRSVPILKTVASVMLDGREHLLESFNDITKRKAAEEALRVSEERFALAVRGSNDGIWDWDIQNNLLYWSPRLKELLGYADDELEVDFETFESHLHPDDRERMGAAIEAHLKDRVLYDVEQRLRTKSGEYRWFRARGQALWDETGNPVRMVGSTTDITERKAAEAERERLLTTLKHRSIQLQTAAEVSKSASTILDPEELMNQAVNLIQERFNFYYVGLFLLDEAGEYAVLQAGTGEAGGQMLRQSHKLQVGGTSMIGWCAAHGKARIALDVGKEAVRFDNPLLPETRSEIALPLISRGRVIGAMTIQSTQPAASEEDIATLQTMADQLANAIENARLFESQTKRATQLALVNEVGRTLTSILDVDTLLGQVVRLIRDTFDYYQVNLGLIEGDALVPKAWVGALSAFPAQAARLNLDAEAIVTKVVTSGTPLLVPDVRREPLYIPLPGLEEVRSELAVPLKSKDQVIGVLDVESDRLAAFDERDLMVLEALAGQIAVTMENARLYAETQRRLQEQIALREAGAAISSALDPETVLSRIAEQMGRAIHATSAYICSYEPETMMHTVLAKHIGPQACAREQVSDLGAIHLEQNFELPEAMQAGQHDIDHIDDPDLTESDRAHMQQYGAQSILYIPLRFRGRLVGYTELWESRRRREFTSEEINLCQDISQQAAIALENARLFQETKANLEEITLLHRRYLQEAWSEFLEEETGRERAGYRYDRGTVSPASAVWRPEIGLAVQRGDTIALSDMADALQGTVEEVGTILQTSPTQSALAVPLKVRGQVIGALDFYETDQARDWSSEEIAMVEAVANQVALAIENARAYEELQKTAEQLKELDRLKTQFLANMSHELRTPLNSIIGFSRVILKGIDGPITEQQRADLTSIYNNGQHLLSMINDILDISKIEASKMELIFEPVDVQQIISGVMSTSAALVKDKPIELKQEVAPNLPIIRSDGTRVRQVILNLLSNAAKFTEKGQITLRAWADEDQITISVKDTGIGISPEHQITIFEEFRQVDASTTRRTGGTGLGLAISRHFVEMHSGRIWVESEPGIGSVFTFTLPITGPEPVAEAELAALTIDPSRKLILTVEDDEGATAIYKRYLEKQGYQVVGLNQGQQAVRWATELSPYAIILDVLLSDEDGWAVLEELKSSRETRQIPVIICTIVDNEEARGLSLGATDYLVKPILEEDLLQSLQRLEERQRI